MNKKQSILLVIVVCILTILVFLFANLNEKRSIGGDRDEYGCLGTAGYSWSNGIGACIREWELDENQREAARIAVNFIGSDKLTVSEVLLMECHGCFLIKLVNPEYVIYQVTLSDWKVDVD